MIGTVVVQFPLLVIVGSFGLIGFFVVALGFVGCAAMHPVDVLFIRPLLDRAAGGGRLTTLWLPLLSAALVTILGAALLWKSIP